MPQFLLFDADILLYQAGWVAEAVIKDETLLDPVNEYEGRLLALSVAVLRNMTKKAEETCKTRKSYYFLSGSKNSRKEKYPTYKENRKASSKPIIFYLLKEWMKRHLLVWETANGLEADDLLGIVQSNMPPESTIIASLDKDLMQIQGWNYNLTTGKRHLVKGFGKLQLIEKPYSNKPVKRLKGDGELFFFAQMLIGDVADNIKGVPKIGNVGAYKLLNGINNYHNALKIVYNEYRNSGLTDDDFNRNYELLWIKRTIPHD